MMTLSIQSCKGPRLHVNLASPVTQLPYSAVLGKVAVTEMRRSGPAGSR
jgi:hypothetical protein